MVQAFYFSVKTFSIMVSVSVKQYALASGPFRARPITPCGTVTVLATTQQ